MPNHVIITGASRGIGRALALLLAERGHLLVLSARSQPELEALATEVQTRFQRASVVCASDLSTPEGIATLERACAGLTLQGLVNNAGFGTAGPFTACDRAAERQMVRLNVEAVVELTHAFVDRLRGQPGAFIVNVASTAGFQPVPLFATYSATKAFVLSFSEALAEELADAGVHVLALCPGATETGFQAVAKVKLTDAANADDVARFALKALDARKRVGVHGFSNALKAFSTRLAPRRLVTRIARKQMEPWFKT
jgi:short-subunit dehydrogenase